jgi:glycosyltransferase involved in cell wall biosynthesis
VVATPAISVVVPTFNRLPRLHQVLEALAQQSLDGSAFEVVVVSDGSTDGTDEYLSGPTPRPVVHARQDNAGPAAARNRGVDLASGRLILFIDDDIVATPTLVERHLLAHGDSTSTVVIGPMSDAPGFKYSPWVAWEQAKLDKQYRAMHDGVYTATFRQFFTGNASLARELFIEAGGFDTTFRRAEDIELSYRLDQLGATFVFDEKAIAHHLAERSFASWIAAADAYGRNDVTFARDHEQRWLLPMMAKEFKERNIATRSLVRVCLTRPRLAALASRGLRAIGGAQWMIPRVSSLALSGLHGLTYYCAAAGEYGDRAEFRAKLCAPAESDEASHG